MSWISRQTLNKHHQEATIIETYLVSLYLWTTELASTTENLTTEVIYVFADVC